MIRYGLYISVLTFLILGCKPEVRNKEELVEYLQNEDNGLLVSKTINDLKISAMYRPTDLIVEQEARPSTPDSVVEALYAKYGKYWYFILSIEKDGKDALYGSAADMTGFSEVLQTLAFRMNDHLYASTSEKDTVYLADYHYSRMFGMSHSTDLLLAFDAQEVQDSKWVQLNLSEFGLSTGRVNLRFKTKDINDIPRIKIKEENE
jgi:hypothetical protein